MDIEIKYTKSVIWTKLPDGFKAWLRYSVENNRMYLLEAYTPPQYRGRGIASKLVDKAIELAQIHGYKIVPVCSYTIYYFMKHPEKHNILSEEFRHLSEEEWIKLFNQRLEQEKHKKTH